MAKETAIKCPECGCTEVIPVTWADGSPGYQWTKTGG